MTYTTAPQPERASLSIPDKRHCDTVSNSCSGPCMSTSTQSDCCMGLSHPFGDITCHRRQQGLSCILETHAFLLLILSLAPPVPQLQPHLPQACRSHAVSGC